LDPAKDKVVLVRYFQQFTKRQVF